jgi:hypothetical protein
MGTTCVLVTPCCSGRCTPETSAISIDIKKSSFKKVSQCLKHMERLGLLTVKETGGVASIVAVQRLHDLFRGVKVEDPDAFKAMVAQREAGATGGGGGGAAPLVASADWVSTAATGKVTVVDLYKIPKQLREVFGARRGQFGEGLRSSELKDVFVQYIKEKEIEIPTDRTSICVPMDDDALFKIAGAVNDAKQLKREKEEIEAMRAAQAAAAARAEALARRRYGGGSGDNDDNGDSDAGYGYDDDEYGDDEVYDESNTSAYESTIGRGAVVAGVWMPSAGSDEGGRASSSSGGGGGVKAKTVFTKPVSFSTAAAKGQSSKAKPPSAPPPVLQPSKTQAQAWPKLGATGHGEAAAAAAAAASAATGNNADTTSVPVPPPSAPMMMGIVVRKDELFKALMAKMSPCHAIITPNGTDSISYLKQALQAPHTYAHAIVYTL